MILQIVHTRQRESEAMAGTGTTCDRLSWRQKNYRASQKQFDTSLDT